MAAMPLREEEIEYPTSDGQPMAETTLHRKVMTDLIAALEHWYLDDPLVWAAGNFLFYYEEGNPRASFAPDVVLFRGIKKWDRPLYKLWEEQRSPDFVIEVTSSATSREDLFTKKDLCGRLRVSEYFLFDPTEDYLNPRLQGYSLEQGRYLRLAQESDGSLLSRITNLRLRPEGENLRLIDNRPGKKLLWISEQGAAIEAAERRAEKAERRAQEEATVRNRLEEEVARLRAELERMRAEG